ncbi:MAG: methylenetetrahydrofolate--tRNA-(uracil(54)-C(5))-methyltransferase (FADH(2)-oxidizing) TrmFO [Vicinamibacterales bacterium]
MPSAPEVVIVGAGLAGSEAAWQIASRGLKVTLYEMRPVRATAVHKSADCAELVCSNSFRGDKLDNAVGLLKEEMRRLGSLVMRVAEASRVPAGAALAVDRERFSRGVTEALESHPRITIVRQEITTIPESSERRPVILATGPLTSEALTAEVARLVGGEHLYFYDAISPIVLAESIDRTRVFRQSRWDRSFGPDGTGRGGGRRRGPRGGRGAGQRPGDLPQADRRPDDLTQADRRPDDLTQAGQGPDELTQADRRSACGVDDGSGDYLNCPLTRDEYERFYDALVHAESATVHDFDKEKFFEGCLPIEVMAHRGVDTLRFGPMKPVGLVDPRTGREPYAAVQLRQDNLAGDHFSLVGFQTQLKWGEQARVLRLIPGLEQAEFVRFGMVHRNTYVNGPTVLAETWQVKRRPTVFLAGQMSGVEGYVESAASGLLAGLNAVSLALGRPILSPPRTTAIGALAYYVSHADPAHYDPTNITFGIMAPLDQPPRGKAQRKAAQSERALVALDAWIGARERRTADGSGPAAGEEDGAAASPAGGVGPAAP